MQIVKLFRFLAFRKVSKRNALSQSDPWPSSLHNKCSKRACSFPNPPQVAIGTYNCQGRRKELPCKGTYNVTPQMASAALWAHKRAKQSRQGQSREATEVEREDTLQRQKREYLDSKSLPPVPGMRWRRLSRSRFPPVSSPLSVNPKRKEKPLPPIPAMGQRDSTDTSCDDCSPAPAKDEVKMMHHHVIVDCFLLQDRLSGSSASDNSSSPHQAPLLV